MRLRVLRAFHSDMDFVHRAAIHRRIGGADSRRAVAVVLPIALPIAMTGTFRVARDRLGERRGYAAGFALYWATCGVVGIWLTRRGGLARLAAPPRSRFGRPAALGLGLLAWPPVGAIATRLVPEIRRASRRDIATIELIAVANAALEELLWRGVYATLWPEDAVLGWAWPAIGFGAWHLAPQVIHPSSMGKVAYLASATALGLSWGWIAWRTGSLRWVALSHVVTDGSGVANARFFLAD